ncbi:MaoC/PaaZ C-terminal domain-containing protein [Bacillus sp. T33-2]|uniref:MaoC/PaaZ C-terminal domain-containing protein n=1 Tax=Bacillus sp. T33-2 TaxID=2054168 RepID=UPI000C75F2C5|nr:MaoC/PaaZ C-terminal domain-containing protein [Bacillus sp. T33-2]PLR91605.1 dehydratase [Bacillus sp. T33-2]
MFNKYFEEYEKGEAWESKGRTITESDIVNFSGISGDFYPLHTDKEYAANTPFKQRIAHGMLVLSAASGLILLEPGRVVAFYGIDQLRFINPVFINDTIQVELKIEDLEDKGNGTGVVTATQAVKKHTGETAIIATIKILLNKQS